MMAVLRNRTLLIMAGAEMVSALGTWIAMQTIYAILIFQNGGGVAQSAAIYVAGLGPMLLLSPVAGWLCDRFDRKRLMIGSELLSALVLTLMLFTDRMDLLYGAMVLVSICGVVMSPARSTSVPDVVAKADLTRANAFMIQMNGITRIGAPLIGAVIVAAVPTKTALLLDVVSYLLSAGLLLLLPALPPRKEAAPAQAAPTGPKASLLATLRSVFREVPIQRLIMPFMFVLGFTLVAFDITASVYVRDVLLGGIKVKGTIASMVGLGMGLGSLALMLAKQGRSVQRDYVIGLALVICLPAAFAVGSVMASIAVARVITFAGCFLGGFGIAIANVQGQTLLQQIVPAGWLGRIAGALQSVVTAGQLIGLFTTPALVPAVVSFGVYFGVASLVLVLISLATIRYLARAHANGGSIPANEVATGD